MSEGPKKINTGSKSDEEAQKIIDDGFQNFTPSEPCESIVPLDIVLKNNEEELKEKRKELEESEKKK